MDELAPDELAARLAVAYLDNDTDLVRDLVRRALDLDEAADTPMTTRLRSLAMTIHETMRFENAPDNPWADATRAAFFVKRDPDKARAYLARSEAAPHQTDDTRHKQKRVRDALQRLHG